MKYFTPELLAAYGSDDPAIWQDAEARWEAASTAYQAALAAIQADLPPGLRQLVDRYYLHDAAIRGMGRRHTTFVIMLQLDTPPQPLLTLTYSLVEEPRIDPEALGPAVRSPGSGVEWQYAELERVPGQPPTWRQSILLSNGWEITLHFRDVQVEEAQALLPAPQGHDAVLPASGLPQSA
jgi:hypothetical protein